MARRVDATISEPALMFICGMLTVVMVRKVGGLVVGTTYEEVCEQLFVGDDVWISLAKGEEAG
jgi:hypothetical protein